MASTPVPAGPANPERLGRYVIDRPIGAGGMGTVYLATDDRDGRSVAVKVLPPSMSRDEGLVARFRREIEALAKLKNPHVVELYECGVEGELHYFAMEYVEGETLSDRIRRGGRIPWREAIDISVQVCSALKSAHDGGVIHRDLKPSNLMLRGDGVVKLTDFGVAQLFAGTRLTKTGGVIGTVEYMSPEQARGGRVTKKSDLYSLGAVLYAMLTGRPPFSGKSSLEVLQKHQHARFDRPVLYAPDIPHWLDELVTNLLEKDPDKRVPDAYVLSRRLAAIPAKVDRSLLDETVAVEDRRQLASGDTVVARTGVGGDGPGVSTLMRDVVRDELIAAARPGLLGRVVNNTWFLLAMLVLLILGGVWWYRSRSLTPEQKFEAGAALMNQPQGDDWITARDDYVQPLLEEDREEWGPKIAPYLKKVRHYELRRALSNGRRPGRMTRPDSEPERFLFLAIQHR
ncbi:MAG: serine/threonine-protein kinase, partial [Planctomycetaceae bacterium]